MKIQQQQQRATEAATAAATSTAAATAASNTGSTASAAAPSAAATAATTAALGGRRSWLLNRYANPVQGSCTINAGFPQSFHTNVAIYPRHHK